MADKKIAVLGNIRLFRVIKREVENPDDLIHIVNEDSIAGNRFSAKLLLFDWYNNYKDSDRILELVNQRIV